MTIKHTNKNISAEDITTLFDVDIQRNQSNNITGIVLTRKNIHDNTNDSSCDLLDYFYLKEQVYNKSEANERVSMHLMVVDEYDDLPAEGQENYIYLVPKSDSGGEIDNYYKEYVWADDGNGDYAYEQIGSTELDLQPILNRISNLENNKLNIAQTSYKGQNVVVDNSTGNIAFEAKNNHTHSQYATTQQLSEIQTGLSGDLNAYLTIASAAQTYTTPNAVDTKISNHDGNNSAHSSIRNLISNVDNKINIQSFEDTYFINDLTHSNENDNNIYIVKNTEDNSFDLYAWKEFELTEADYHGNVINTEYVYSLELFAAIPFNLDVEEFEITYDNNGTDVTETVAFVTINNSS